MTNEQAIAELQKEHDLIQGEHDLDGSQFAPALLEALAMAIEALKAQNMTLYMNLPEVSAEEAVEILKRNNRIELISNDKDTNVPSKDCIDRAEAQTAIQFAARRYTVAHEAHGAGKVVWSDNLISVTDAMNALREVPPAQPENDWIPCTKKAHPDTPFRVQVQMDNGWIITAYYQDGEWLSVPDCGEPLLDKWIEAWRELPEPYQECEQDEH